MECDQDFAVRLGFWTTEQELRRSDHSHAETSLHDGLMHTQDLAEERYISLTTFKKDGTPRQVPVWAVDAGDGRLGFVTSPKTWKVKRMINNARVEVQPSDSRGKVKEGSEPVQGTAEVVEDQEFESVEQLVKAKYGYQLKIINFMHSLPGKRMGHTNDRAVIITLDAA